MPVDRKSLTTCNEEDLGKHWLCLRFFANLCKESARIAGG